MFLLVAAHNKLSTWNKELIYIIKNRTSESGADSLVHVFFKYMSTHNTFPGVLCTGL